MSTITPVQALQLASSYNDSANELGQFRLRNWDNLSPDDRAVTANIGKRLIGYSQSLVTDAVGKLLDDTQASLAAIKLATADANHTIQTINSIKKVINVAAALVTLAAAISTENPAGIAQGLQDVVSAVSGSNSSGKAGNGKTGNATGGN